MRTRTGPENTVLASAFRWIKKKVEVKDAAGSWQDLSGYLMSVSWGADVDAPIAEAQVQFRRDNGEDSLSPFRGDSPLNAGGAAIDAGREIRISPATIANGGTAVGGDYKQLFLGVIDSVDFGTSTISIVARDLGGALVDSFIESESTYGTEAGEPLQDVIQSVLDEWAPTVALEAPDDPGFDVTEYTISEAGQGKDSVYAAVRTLAGLPGWDLRYLWDDSSSSFKLTLFEPDRTKTDPDWTFARNRYIAVSQLAISRELVRNYIVVTFTNADNGMRESVYAFDPLSIARFGRRWMEIEEGSTLPINTTEEAQALADAALSDLAWPIAEQKVEMPFFWAVDLNDLIRFTADTVRSDEDLDLAVTGYQHELSQNKERTTLTVRGKPAGFYRDWIRRGSGSGEATDDNAILNALSLSNFRETSRTETSVTYEWARGENVSQIWVYTNLVQNPPSSEPWPADGASPTTILTTQDTITFDIPDPGYLLYVQIEPKNDDLVTGRVVRLILSPTLDPLDRIIAAPILVFDNDGSVAVRVDAPTTTLSYRYAYSLFTLGTSPTHPTDAEVEAGTVRTISGEDAFTLPAGTVGYNQGLRMRFAPYLNADGTGKDGVTDHGEIKASEDMRLHPPVTLEITNEANNGTILTFEVTVRDAGGHATALYYRTQAGAATPGAWTLKSASPTHNTAYSQTLTLEEGHPVYLEYRLDFTENGSTGEVHQKSNGAEKGKFPQIAIIPEISQTGAATASVSGSVNTASIKVAASTSGVPSDATVRAQTAINGRDFTPAMIGTLVTANIGQTVFYKAFGYSLVAGGGNESSSAAVAQRTRTSKNAPDIKATWSRSSTVAALDLTINDALAKITAIELNKREGAGAATGFVSTWDRTSGTIGSSTALTRGEDVAITAGFDSEIQYRVTYTDENGNAQTVGGGFHTSNLDQGTLKKRLAAHALLPYIDSETWIFGISSVSPLIAGASALCIYRGAFQNIPDGSLLTKFRARMSRVSTSDTADVLLYKATDDGAAPTLLATLTHTGTGWSSYEAVLSNEATTNFSLVASAELQNDAAGRASIAWAELEYTPPVVTSK